jgi:hypothetical protein
LGLPLFAAWGEEIVWALRRAGFYLLSIDAEHATLENDHARVVAVPRGRLLEPDELLAVLRTAGVSYSDFVELLDAPFPAEEPSSESLPKLHVARRREAH